MDEKLEPIPTPPAHFWRQIRMQYLPGIVFAAGLVAAIIIWMEWVAPPALVGEAQSVHADVRAPHLGSLLELKVDELQQVTAGQEIGRIAEADPLVLESSLAVIRAQIDVIRTTMDPVIAQQKLGMDYERLQLDWMSERVKLASLKAQLQLAQANLARSEPLFKNNLLTEERFDELKSLRDSLTAQVQAETELIDRIEPGLKSLASDAASGTNLSTATGLASALKVQEEKLRLTEAKLGSVALIAPVTGVVTIVHRHPGETVTVGESILQIASSKVDRIVGYLREPVPLDLRPGASVEVRTRTLHRQRAHATVAAVGNQLEPITPTLLAAMRLPTTAQLAELGLRVNITVPVGFVLRPGEHVDIIIHN